MVVYMGARVLLGTCCGIPGGCDSIAKRLQRCCQKVSNMLLGGCQVAPGGC